MKQKFTQEYQAALISHLEEGPKATVRGAKELGEKAIVVGFRTLEMAKLHEKTLVETVLPKYPRKKRAAIIKQAGCFFTEAITPSEKNGAPRRAAVHLVRVVEKLSQRTVDLAASNLSLHMEIGQRKTVEAALKKSQQHYTELLQQSDQLQEELRQLSRRILFAQEEERREISRELHDVIAQTLTGINVRLFALQKEAAIDTKGLDANIARTQRLVEQSVAIVHRFARELRPAVLDDLGLVPALQSFMKRFTERTGVRTRLTVSSGFQTVDLVRRTALYRIAQEALTNVDRHAQATTVEVKIQQTDTDVAISIADDGQSFELNGGGVHKKTKRLGILGMRERVEMVGGKLSVESVKGKGTVVHASVPRGKLRIRPAAAKLRPVVSKLSNRYERS